MSEQTAGALRVWFKRVEPLYPELFNTAHVICGNYDQAENALRGGILDVWVENGENSMGFRERLRGAVREEALRLSRSDSADHTWRGISEVVDDPISVQAAKEDIETQRLLVLRYGVGLSLGRIALVTGMPASLTKSTLGRFEARCKRRLPSKDQPRFDRLLAQSMRRQLNARSGLPHPAAIYRAFEAEAAALQPPAHRLTAIVYRALVLVMALICAALFWLFAVLVQPPDIEANPTATRYPQSQPGTQIETIYESEAPAR